MKVFSQLFESLEQANSVDQKIEYIISYLKVANQQDIIWALGLLYGKRPSKIVTSYKLLEWAKEESNLPEWLFNESENSTKDIAELLSLILPSPKEYINIQLSDFISDVIKMKTKPENEVKKSVINYWKQFESNEKYILNKLILGSFKMNADKKVVLEALSLYCKIDKYSLAYNLQLNWHPSTTTFAKLIDSNLERATTLKPFEFCETSSFNDELSVLGNYRNWIIEYSWIGLRAQIIVRNKQLYIWSNQFDYLTEKLPEFWNLNESATENFVFDGILLPFKNGKHLPIQDLYSRLKRKTTTSKLLRECPIIFMAFDILEYNKEDLRSNCLKQRKELLEQVVQSNLNQNIYLQESFEINSWIEVGKYKVAAKSQSANGIVLKSLTDNYKTKQTQWFKLNLQPMSIIAVLYYVTQEFGAETVYTFALKKGEELVSFVKTAIGLNEEDKKQVDIFVKENKLERFGPVRMVKPELVFEIEFDNISFSKRHKAGVVLKTPRIKKWHKEKKVNQINTLAELLLNV